MKKIKAWTRRIESYLSELVSRVSFLLWNRKDVVRTGLKRSQWHEIDDRMLHGCFALLVEYVEDELTILCADQVERFGKRDAALEYLQWEMGLTKNETHGLSPGDPRYGKPTLQAEHAKIIRGLYLYWTTWRPEYVERVESSLHLGNSWVDKDEALYRLDNYALKKLISIRSYLWV